MEVDNVMIPAQLYKHGLEKIRETLLLARVKFVSELISSMLKCPSLGKAMIDNLKDGPDYLFDASETNIERLLEFGVLFQQAVTNCAALEIIDQDTVKDEVENSGLKWIWHPIMVEAKKAAKAAKDAKKQEPTMSNKVQEAMDALKNPASFVSTLMKGLNVNKNTSDKGKEPSASSSSSSGPRANASNATVTPAPANATVTAIPSAIAQEVASAVAGALKTLLPSIINPQKKNEPRQSREGNPNANPNPNPTPKPKPKGKGKGKQTQNTQTPPAQKTPKQKCDHCGFNHATEEHTCGYCGGKDHSIKVCTTLLKHKESDKVVECDCGKTHTKKAHNIAANRLRKAGKE